jgi:hypothetical protein
MCRKGSYIIFLMFFVLLDQSDILAQRVVLPSSAYGVWDRGDGITEDKLEIYHAYQACYQ